MEEKNDEILCGGQYGRQPTTPVPLSGDFCEQMRKAQKWGMTPLKSMCRTSLFWIFRPFRRACGKRVWKWRRLGRARSTADMGLHLCDADEQRQQELFERVCAFIDCAAQLNARVTIGSIKGNIRPDEDREKHLDILGKALKRIDDYARAEKCDGAAGGDKPV